MKKTVLITGGAGFVGHHITEHFLKETDWNIAIFDKLTYASSGLDRVRDISAFDEDRVFLYSIDLTQEVSEGIIKELKNEVNYIINLAAESHVDRSIENPVPFIESNVMGTHNMLWFARKLNNLEAFVQFGTDEQFGPAPENTFFKEWDRYNCTNPYAATKAAAEQLALAYANTYNLPIFCTISMNIFGERQHPEKFIPICIRKILNNETIYIHSDATKSVSGSRHWIHARNVAQGIHFLLDRFKQRDKYNIAGSEITNLQLAQIISRIIGKELHYEMLDFHSSRPGHDLRYALDNTKMKELGWKPPVDLYDSLEKTVRWTLDNRKWLDI